MWANLQHEVRGAILRVLVTVHVHEFNARCEGDRFAFARGHISSADFFQKMYKGGHFACARGRNTAYTGGQFALPVVAMRMRFLEA